MDASQPAAVAQKELLTCTPEFPEVGAGRAQPIGVVVSFAAPHMADENERLPIRLSAVLDKSGSMAGTKLELVKATTRFLLQQLRPTDSLGIVCYDTEVEETLPFQEATPAMKQSTQALIDKISDGSCTNLSGGLFRGLQQLHSNQPKPTPEGTEKWAVDAVFLFTDGQANVGITDEAQLSSMLQTLLLPTGKKVKVHTFGFGDDHNPGLLQKISDVSAGDYYYIRSEEEIPTAFAEALGGLLSVSAQNVVLTITAGAGIEIDRVQTPFPTARQPGGSYKITIGDLYTEEQKDLLVTLRLPLLATPAPTDPPHPPHHCRLPRRRLGLLLHPHLHPRHPAPCHHGPPRRSPPPRRRPPPAALPDQPRHAARHAAGGGRQPGRCPTGASRNRAGAELGATPAVDACHGGRPAEPGIGVPQPLRVREQGRKVNALHHAGLQQAAQLQQPLSGRPRPHLRRR